VKLYYNFHLKRYGRKGVLNDEIKRKLDGIIAIQSDPESSFVTPLAEHGLFSAFSGLDWIRDKDQHIGVPRPTKRNGVTRVKGAATLFDLADRPVERLSPPRKKMGIDKGDHTGVVAYGATGNRRTKEKRGMLTDVSVHPQKPSGKRELEQVDEEDLWFTIEELQGEKRDLEDELAFLRRENCRLREEIRRMENRAIDRT
jgi:hypothetical protein